MSALLAAPINGGEYIPAPMRQLKPTEDKFARAQARGWNDVRDGKGIGQRGSHSENYDKWKRKVQFAYERGRFRATLAKLQLVKGRKRIGIWHRDETVSDVLDRTCGFDARVEIMDATANVRQRRAS